MYHILLNNEISLVPNSLLVVDVDVLGSLVKRSGVQETHNTQTKKKKWEHIALDYASTANIFLTKVTLPQLVTKLQRKACTK